MPNKVIASLVLCNTASLNIYDVIYDINDYVVVGMNNNKPRKYRVYSSSKGLYFIWGGHRYYLNEFIRI